MQVIYNYISETKYVPREHLVAVILVLLVIIVIIVVIIIVIYIIRRSNGLFK
jgi:hypothetical protein